MLQLRDISYRDFSLAISYSQISKLWMWLIMEIIL